MTVRPSALTWREGAIGKNDGTGRRPKPSDELAGFGIGARRIGAAGGEDGEGQFARQLYQLGAGLDRGQVEGA